MNTLLEVDERAAGLHRMGSLLRGRSRAVRKRCYIGLPLLRQLDLIGNNPFKEEGVKEYETKKLSLESNLPQARRSLSSYIMTIASIAIFSYLTGALHAVLWKMALSVCVGIMVTFVVWVLSGPQQHGNITPFWTTISLPEYQKGLKRQVPEKALELVREIQTRLPRTHAYVRYLASDPFLILTHSRNGKREEYYVDVWDEKGFAR